MSPFIYGSTGSRYVPSMLLLKLFRQISEFKVPVCINVTWFCICIYRIGTILTFLELGGQQQFHYVPYVCVQKIQHWVSLWFVMLYWFSYISCLPCEIAVKGALLKKSWHGCGVLFTSVRSRLLFEQLPLAICRLPLFYTHLDSYGIQLAQVLIDPSSPC